MVGGGRSGGDEGIVGMGSLPARRPVQREERRRISMKVA